MVRTWGDQTLKDDWASASKPLINTLLFFAVQENRIDRVEDPVIDLVLPATGGTLRPADQSMTFFQLMNMTSGYARIENPGAAWAYNDVAVQFKNLLVGEVFGELPDAPIRARLAPLQLQDGSLFTTRGGYGLSTTTRDFARIAWFWMNRGSWRGQQVQRLLAQAEFSSSAGKHAISVRDGSRGTDASARRHLEVARVDARFVVGKLGTSEREGDV